MRISDWSSDVCSSDLIDDLGLGELLEAFDALLAADTGLLGPAERDIERHVEMFVHPHRARLDLQCDMETALGIIGPDRTAQPIFTVIGATDDVLDRVIGQHRDRRAKLDRKSTRLNSSH